MPITPNEFLRNVNDLVALPEVCFRVNELVDDPNSSAATIAQVIAQDPSLAAQLLRIANSPYYGFPSRVETLSRAITVIGMQDLRDLVLSTSVINAFSHKANELIDMQSYWSHSLFTGFIARQLGSKTSTKILCKERLFVAGLLHDIGQLVMSLKIPEIMKIILHRAESGVEPYYDIEKLVFGLGHAEIGAALLKKWHMPESLQAVARYHHEPDKAQDHLLEVSIVHIANAMAHVAKHHGVSGSFQEKISATAWRVTGLEKAEVVAAVEQARTEIKQSMPVFFPTAKAANE